MESVKMLEKKEKLKVRYLDCLLQIKSIDFMNLERIIVHCPTLMFVNAEEALLFFAIHPCYNRPGIVVF